ncbi:hypothetical protein O3P69_010532 [Scylla paramamosain]|uniref:Uncharacterized protein n=1 Tax=Scylla paramamosain TaxID=85552 RepID=A0AAW0SH33_SCYPA
MLRKRYCQLAEAQSSTKNEVFLWEARPEGDTRLLLKNGRETPGDRCGECGVGCVHRHSTGGDHVRQAWRGKY